MGARSPGNFHHHAVIGMYRGRHPGWWFAMGQARVRALGQPRCTSTVVGGPPGPGRDAGAPANRDWTRVGNYPCHAGPGITPAAEMALGAPGRAAGAACAVRASAACGPGGGPLGAQARAGRLIPPDGTHLRSRFTVRAPRLRRSIAVHGPGRLHPPSLFQGGSASRGARARSGRRGSRSRTDAHPCAPVRPPTAHH